MGRRQALSARRRLLGLLVVLAAGSGALAGTRMAAWWVVVPPGAMLLGYLPLLRAAAKVDADRRRWEARQQAAAEYADDYDQDVDPVTYAAEVPVEAHVAPFAAAGFASPAEIVDYSDDDEIYDQYTDAKLRAVGD